MAKTYDTDTGATCMISPNAAPDETITPASEPAEVAIESSPATQGAEDQAGVHQSAAGRRWKGAMREFLETAILALVIFLAVRTFVMNYRVIGHSMQPTIEEGQFLLIDKLFYDLGESRRGDVVVLHPPDMPGQIYIKRVVGIPGDTVEIRDGQLYINEQAVVEPWTTRPYPTSNWGPGMVGSDELMVLGDNRPGSRDSRYFGMLPKEKVIGRAFLCYWPPEKWNTYPQYDPQTLGLAE
jgi:signal peptidase I